MKRGCDYVDDTFAALFVDFDETLILFIQSILGYVALDMFIAFLYWNQIRIILKEDQCAQVDVHMNIEFILYRILTMMVFYLFLAVVIMCSSFAFTSLLSVVFSIAMYLMQDHNTGDYEKFLRILNGSKLYLCCCCCCGRMIERQHKALVVRRKSECPHPMPSPEKKSPTAAILDVMNTEHAKSGMEFSLETVTVLRTDTGRSAGSGTGKTRKLSPTNLLSPTRATSPPGSRSTTPGTPEPQTSPHSKRSPSGKTESLRPILKMKALKRIISGTESQPIVLNALSAPYDFGVTPAPDAQTPSMGISIGTIPEETVVVFTEDEEPDSERVTFVD